MLVVLPTNKFYFIFVYYNYYQLINYYSKQIDVFVFVLEYVDGINSSIICWVKKIAKKKNNNKSQMANDV